MNSELKNDWSDVRHYQLTQMARIVQKMREQCQAVIATKGLDNQGLLVFRNIIQGISAGETNLKSMARKAKEVNPIEVTIQKRHDPSTGNVRWKRVRIDPTYTGRLFTINDLIDLLEITKQGIYYHVKRKKIPAPYRLGHRSVWRADELSKIGITFPKDWKSNGRRCNDSPSPVGIASASSLSPPYRGMTTNDDTMIDVDDDK